MFRNSLSFSRYWKLILKSRTHKSIKEQFEKKTVNLSLQKDTFLTGIGFIVKQIFWNFLFFYHFRWRPEVTVKTVECWSLSCIKSSKRWPQPPGFPSPGTLVATNGKQVAPFSRLWRHARSVMGPSEQKWKVHIVESIILDNFCNNSVSKTCHKILRVEKISLNDFSTFSPWMEEQPLLPECHVISNIFCLTIHQIFFITSEIF